MLRTHLVIPDCCNIGVIARTLIAVNGAVLAAVLARAAGWQSGWRAFVEASVLVELACLCSLPALCALRKPIAAMPPVWQRAASALVPAVVTALVMQFLASLDAFMPGMDGWTLTQAAAGAALMGSVLQHYFELRARAFSPALAEARLQALQARIRPHFLFNSLNAVLSLIRTEPRQAEAALEDMAELFRVLLRDARDMTSLEQEIRLCRQYLAIEKIRLGERLQVAWDLGNLDEEMMRQAQIPALLLQPLLENAVHHGVEPAREPVAVKIRMSRSIDRIDIAISNPYHGAGAAGGNHMALDNIRERLALLYDVEAQLVTAVAHGSFEVRLRIPFIRTNK